jgi:hypothetical protein
MDEEAAWDGWMSDSDISDSSSEGWIDIEGEGDIVVSDSDDDATHAIEPGPPTVALQFPTLATTKVCCYKLALYDTSRHVDFDSRRLCTLK